MLPDAARALAAWINDPWLVEALGGDTDARRRSFVAAGRKLGRDPLTAPAGSTLTGPDDAIDVAGWSRDCAGRVALLGAIATDPNGTEIVEAISREGDNREKTAVVRALCLLPDGERFLELALDTGRTNDTELFAALACGNPFPARHYPELAFNKLVMKSAFVGVPIDAIVGLGRRANRELSRMALEYIDEQESARRRFPPEMFLAVAPHAGDLGVARMLGYLCHSITENRVWAARGLAIANDRDARRFLEARLATESVPEARSAIEAALSPNP